MFYIQCDVHKARKDRLGGAAFGDEKENPMRASRLLTYIHSIMSFQ